MVIGVIDEKISTLTERKCKFLVGKSGTFLTVYFVMQKSKAYSSLTGAGKYRGVGNTRIENIHEFFFYQSYFWDA